MSVNLNSIIESSMREVLEESTNPTVDNINEFGIDDIKRNIGKLKSGAEEHYDAAKSAIKRTAKHLRDEGDKHLARETIRGFKKLAGEKIEHAKSAIKGAVKGAAEKFEEMPKAAKIGLAAAGALGAGLGAVGLVRKLRKKK